MSDFFVVHLLETGEVLQSVQCPEEFMLCGPHERYVPAPALVDPDLWYVQGGQLVKRPVLTVQISGHQLLGVPTGAQILIEGQVYRADGSTIELDFPLPGSYEITVAQWPYLDWRGVYEVKA